MKEWLYALDHEGGDNAQADVAWHGKDEAVQEQRPQGYRRVNNVVADDVVIHHAHCIDYQKASKICQEIKGDFLAGILFSQIGSEPGAHGEAYEIAKARLEYIPKAAALRKDRQADKAEQHIGQYRHSAPAATQQKPCQHGEQVLQGKGNYWHWNLDESTDGNECNKKPAIGECPGFVIAMGNSSRQLNHSFSV